MRLPQLRLKTAMVGIAFLALFLTVFVQSILLQRAMVREQLLRARAESNAWNVAPSPPTPRLTPQNP
jgi:hypothetical protein